ncbi:MAG: siderophore biosynthesis protein [Brevibacillus sp.]|nr:siderophore biosynthesis protein [Brevibacillus sp.]
MEWTRQDMSVAKAMQSEQYAQVFRRVFRQLIESLIYEGVVVPETEQAGIDTIFLIHGQDEQGRPVCYKCRGRRRVTFGRIRLNRDPVLRIAADSVRPADSLTLFVAEVLGPIGVDETRLQSFSNELEQTLFNDTLAQCERDQRTADIRGKDYDDFEGEMMVGHLYHPGYKSRIGFDYTDHYAYGPEFKQTIRLVWLAVHRDHAKVAFLPGLDYHGWLISELGEPLLERFFSAIRDQGCDPQEYCFLPVHPWQWRKHIAPSFVSEIRARRIVVLGLAGDEYVPQQSIRTLANRTSPYKPYVKLSMNLLNTSVSRHLPPTFVTSAPVVSEWLCSMRDKDPYLRDEARLILLREFAGISYDPPPICRLDRAATFGAIGCIWRESLHRYLDADEEAVPFTGLCSLDAKGRPLIEPWLREYGITNWLERLFERCVLPVVHLLVGHGVALETHAQNMVLVHRGGLPVRAALKDFHEDVLFCRAYLREPQKCPDFAPDTLFEMDDVTPVRNLTLGALFFINLGELALLLADRYGYEEFDFWALAADVLEGYPRRFPQLGERFARFQLFSPSCRVEQLTKRRLYPDPARLVHEVPNPIYLVQQQRASR